MEHQQKLTGMSRNIIGISYRYNVILCAIPLTSTHFYFTISRGFKNRLAISRVYVSWRDWTHRLKTNRLQTPRLEFS